MRLIRFDEKYCVLMSNPNQGFTMENWFETNETQAFLAFDCGNVIWIEEDLETQTKMHIENAWQCLNIVKSHCVNKGNENSKKDIF